MSEVRLFGQLVCKTEDEANIVGLHLPLHIQLTRAERGCVSFEVTRTDNLLIWSVVERFEDEREFEAHQTRVARSAWGQATAGIERRYQIEGLSC
ncbi:antibiotic biosynthesis monooxygenase [Leifsonia sp. EB34]|uniref:antibiotic biosynthesis monooxygenase n=1 Tax=Leifsonia sp. EB34 TaxID=3156303 RepID=UPI003516B78F